MMIFSITFCTLATVYCACKIVKDTFRIVLYITTFYMQHCPVYRASDMVRQKMGNSAALSREIMRQERSIMRQIMRFL